MNKFLISKISKGTKMDQIYIPKNRINGFNLGTHVFIIPADEMPFDLEQKRTISKKPKKLYQLSHKKALQKLKREIIPILKKHDVKRAGIFGSYARGDFNKNSDVDILIEFIGRKSLFDLSGLEIDLEEKFNMKFDVLTYNSLNSLIKKQVLKEEIKIYDKK
jgi:uncharacterized protein